MPSPHLKIVGASAKPPIDEDICLFAQTNFRNQMRRFGIKTDDRRRHMYVVGKTGMGKTTMMENMVLHDMYSGHGLGIVDPHGDFAEKMINFIPPHRINDVVYFNPADMLYPIGFNILEVKSEEQKHLVASGLMGIFKKIWPDVWSSRMEYILNNTLLALLDYPGSTLLGINRLLADKKYRRRVITKLKDPVVKAFWQTEFANYNDKYAQEAVAPIQNKIGQFLSASVIRNIVAQVKSTINIREIMDSGKILIMNLSKGRIGEDNSRLLGGMLITQVQLAAMERVDTPEKDRRDFFLYVDEFQNFASPSFANILSEARKYRLSLIMAHQYILQLDELVANAVFGNVGTIVTFRVGGADAEVLVKEFTPTFLEEDIVNLAKYRVFLKLMIDGVASQPFSATTMPPVGRPTGTADKVIRVSRERYAVPREQIEDKIMRWSGMEADNDDGDDDIDGDDSETSPDMQKAVRPSPGPKNQPPVVSNRPQPPAGAPPKNSISVPIVPKAMPVPIPPISQASKAAVSAPTTPRPSPQIPTVSSSPLSLSALPARDQYVKNTPSTPTSRPFGQQEKNKDMSTTAVPSSGGQTAIGGDRQQKKKRKRKRKSATPLLPTPPTVAPAPAVSISPILTVTPPTPQATPAQKIAPDQVVTFD